MENYCVFLGTKKQCDLVLELIKSGSHQAKGAKEIFSRKNSIINYAVFTTGLCDFTNKLLVDEIPVLILNHFKVV